MAFLRISDDRGRELLFARPPRRVVSLVPSETLSLFDLGAGALLVGRTRFCVEPPEAVRLPEVGGTKDAEAARVLDLSPDLVLANQEENARPALEALARAGVPVFISFPRTVGEGLSHLGRLARLLDLGGDAGVRDLLRRSAALVAEAEAALRRDAADGRAPLDAFVPIWMEPLMTISGDTFVSDVVRLAGGRNVFADRRRKFPLAADLGRAPALSPDSLGGRDVRYPRVPIEEVEERDPEVILLPDEPHPFSPEDAARLGALRTRAGRTGRIAFVDGKDLTWPGTRSLTGVPRLRERLESLRATGGGSTP